MTCKLPITVEDFKAYFCKDAGFEFQPYPNWVKTVFDTGDYCAFGGVYYKSTVDKNIVEPAQDAEGWSKESDIYEDGYTYIAGSVVLYNGVYFKALNDTTSLPTDKEFWVALTASDLDELFPAARPWAVPTAYQTGDKVIGMVNYKLGVYMSTIDANYYDPAQSLYETNPIPMYAWELQEDEEVDWILDSDIERAMGEACFKFNPGLVPNADKLKIIALYLTAFFVVYDRQMANSGLNGSSSSGPVRSRTVGKMSVSYMESKLFEKHPTYEFFARNQYGIKAFNLLLPFLRGNVLVLNGRPSAE